MKIIQTKGIAIGGAADFKELSKFNPVTVVFETAAELQYVTKMLGMARLNIGEAFTGISDFDMSPIYEMLWDECHNQDIDTDDHAEFYIEKRAD